MPRKSLTKNEYQALIDFKNSLNKKFPREILELKLFGSKVRGDFHKESDIDVLVVLKRKSREIEDFILDLTLELLKKYEVLISPVIFSKREVLRYKKIPSVFLQIVEREAVSL